jgi:cell wall-associated NlpC family hydrolase
MPKTMIRWIAAICMMGPGIVLADTSDATTEIPMLALSLVGTPYRYGGDDARSGLDCSGLVNRVYLDAAHIRLPRDAAGLSQSGQAIERNALEAGDLVFFNTLNRPASHVGIYLGDGRFVHASGGAGGVVMLSSLDDPYWVARYDGARRVLATVAVRQTGLRP